MKAKVLLFAGAFSLMLPLLVLVRADEPSASPPAATEPADVSEVEETEAIPLHGRQDAISQRFKRFERLLLQMAEYMRKTDPEQADLLVRAIGQSKSDRISGQMEQIAILLQQDQLGDALDREQQVIDSLQGLLELLQSGERRDELKREQERIRDLLKDLDVTIGKTKDARASNERGDETERAINRQEIAENSAQQLLDKIDGQDSKRTGKQPDDAKAGKESDGKEGDSKEGDSKEGDAKEGEGKEGDPKEGDSKEGEPKDEDKNSKEGKPGDPKAGKPGKPGKESKPGDPMEGDPMEGEAGEPKEGEGKPKPGKPGKPGQPGQPGESPMEPGDSSEQPPQDGQQPNAGEQQAKNDKTPGRDEVARAIERMDRAIEELKKQNRDGASKEQSKAIADLEEARAKLEEILRQLREEERELLLAALEARFQKMLTMQMMVYTGTVNLGNTPKEQWTSRHQGRSRELAQVEDEIALEAVKALDLLKEEGSSVAFPEAIEQMRQDMLTVSGNLERSEVGELTQLIEQDIIEALQELVEALQKEMEKNKNERKESPQAEQGQKADPALVDKLAELKMLRSLQMRINRRTKVLAREFRGEQTENAQAVQLLQELSRRQSRIQQTAYDLATGRNQ